MFKRSLRAETHLGPDGTRLEQNAQARLKSLYKHAGHHWSMKIKEKRKRFEDTYEMKVKKTMATPNKIQLNNFNVSL